MKILHTLQRGTIHPLSFHFFYFIQIIIYIKKPVVETSYQCHNQMSSCSCGGQGRAQANSGRELGVAESYEHQRARRELPVEMGRVVS